MGSMGVCAWGGGGGGGGGCMKVECRDGCSH